MDHGIIMTIIIGLVAGGLAKMIIGGSNPSGWIITAVLGIAGSFVGNFIAKALHIVSTDSHKGIFMSIIVSTVGAAVLLVIYHFIQKAQASA